MGSKAQRHKKRNVPVRQKGKGKVATSTAAARGNNTRYTSVEDEPQYSLCFETFIRVWWLCRILVWLVKVVLSPAMGILYGITFVGCVVYKFVITLSVTRASQTSGECLFEIEAAPRKGLGMFAIKHIKEGTEILVEDAILKGARDWFCKEALFMVLPEDKKEAFNALYSQCNCGKVPCMETPFMKIFEVNSFDANEESRLGDRAPYIYLTASRINHDCDPNTYRYYTREKYVVFTAARDIQAGEEITTTYIGNFGDTKLRRSSTAKWGFICQCQSCRANRTLTIFERVQGFANRVVRKKLMAFGTRTNVLGKATTIEKDKEREVMEWYNEDLKVLKMARETNVRMTREHFFRGGTREEFRPVLADIFQASVLELLAQQQRIQSHGRRRGTPHLGHRT